MTGRFNISNFAVPNYPSGALQLVATGNLIATLSNAVGLAQTVALNNVTAPVQASGTCPIARLAIYGECNESIEWWGRSEPDSECVDQILAARWD